MTPYAITSPSGQELLAELPGFYEPIRDFRVIVQAEGEQFDRLQADLEDQLAQRFVGSATWGLEAWERELSITPPAGQPIEQRRAVVRSRMRGYGKFTGRLLKSVAEAYDNGTVDVSFDPASSTFTVTFVSTRGIPANVNDALSAITEIIPAHLLVAFRFTYLTFGELDSSGQTFGDLKSLNLSFEQLEKWKP